MNLSKRENSQSTHHHDNLVHGFTLKHENSIAVLTYQHDEKTSFELHCPIPLMPTLLLTISSLSKHFDTLSQYRGILEHSLPLEQFSLNSLLDSKNVNIEELTSAFLVIHSEEYVCFQQHFILKAWLTSDGIKFLLSLDSYNFLMCFHDAYEYYKKESP